MDFSFFLPVLLGLIVGFVLAMTGAGGGILAVPLLILCLNLSIQQAAPIGLLAVGLAAGVGAILAFREGQLRYRAAGLMGTCGIFTAPFGIYCANQLASEPLMLGFALILIWLAYKTLRRANHEIATSSDERPQLACQINPNTGRFSWNRPCAAALAMTGAASGFLSGLLGVGGGFVIVPTLSRHSDLKTHSAIATALAVIALVAISGICTAAIQGSLNWLIALPFAAGALTGMFFGNRLASRLDSKRLQQGFSLICFTAAGLLLIQALGVPVFR